MHTGVINQTAIPLGKKRQIAYANSMQNADDEILMKRFKAGDASAFEVLYERYRVSLFRFIQRSVQNAAVAEELFQDVWIKLIDAKSRYRVEAKFRTYLYRIAHNRMIDFFRSKKPLQSFDESPVENALSDPGLHSEALIELNRKTKALKTAIAELPIDQRTAFVLKAEQGLSLEEIAIISGVGRETIKSRLRYAMDKLRISLGDLYEHTSE